MKLLALVISLLIFNESVNAQLVPPPRERTELDQVLEEERSFNPTPLSGFHRYREPFLDTPSLNDFPRLSPPPPIGFPRSRYFHYDEMLPRPRPVVPPFHGQSAHCGEWEKVHKMPGDVVIENGCRIVVKEESWVTDLGGTPVPSWANWFRYCDGAPQFSQ